MQILFHYGYSGLIIIIGINVTVTVIKVTIQSYKHGGSESIKRSGF